MKTTVYIIIESSQTIPSEVLIFFSAEEAGKEIQQHATSPYLGHRKKRKNESWTDYLDAWNFFLYDSDAAVLQTGTWCIHWFKIDNVSWPDTAKGRRAASAVQTIYRAIKKHADFEVFEEPEKILELLESAMKDILDIEVLET